MSDFKKKLKQMNKDWKDGKDTPPGPPDGNYVMQLQDLDLRESNAGKLYIYREHLILEGEYEGEVARDMMSLETEKGPWFVAKFIDQMGYESPDDIMDLPETLEAIKEEAPVYTAGVKNTGDFINVRILEAVESAEVSSSKKNEEETGLADKVEKGIAIAKGDTVQFEDADEGIIVGEVVDDSDEDNYHIEDADGEVWSCPLADLELAEAEDEEEEVEEEEQEEEEDVLTALLALAQSYEVEEVDEDDTIDTLVEKLSDYEWNEDDLTPEEVQILEDQGIEVTKPKKEKAKPKRNKNKKV